jgi:hypothetical protein
LYISCAYNSLFTNPGNSLSYISPVMPQTLSRTYSLCLQIEGIVSLPSRLPDDSGVAVAVRDLDGFVHGSGEEQGVWVRGVEGQVADLIGVQRHVLEAAQVKGVDLGRGENHC